MSSSNDKKLSTREVSYNPFKDGKILSAVPTTGHQREIFATIKLEPDATIAFNEVLDLTLKGTLKVDVLQLALEQVVERHSILRSVFSADGEFLLVKEKMPLPLRVLKADSQTLTELHKIEVTTPFDLLHGPCFRGTLVPVSETEHHLILSFHHVICDGWSLAIILNEISQIYSSLLKSSNLILEDVDSFIEYAAELSEKPERVSSFWLNQFKSLPSPIEWGDKARPQFRTYQSKRFDFEFSSEIVRIAKTYAAQNGLSLYAFLMSVFSWSIANKCQQSDLVIGMASAAQANLGRINLVGHLVSLLPLRVRLENGQSFKAHTANVKQGMLQAFANPHLTFGELINELKIPRDPARIPLVSIVFNIDQQNPDQGLAFEGLKASYETVPRVSENFELFVNVVSRGEHLSIECQYNTDLLSEKYVSDIFNAFEDLLKDPAAIGALLIQSHQLKRTQSVEVHTEPGSSVFVSDILKVWSKILARDVSAKDNFFALGGHSLLAVESARLLSDQTGYKVAAKHIFACPTAQQLSGLIETLPKSKSSSVRSSIKNTGPLSPAQWQAWYLEQVNPTTRMHNLPSAIRLKMGIDLDKLNNAFKKLIARQPSLRLSVTDGNHPQQKITDVSLSNTWKGVDYLKCSEVDLIDELEKLASEKININEAPLFKATLIEIGPQDFVLFFMVHHLAWDGWSFDIFFSELDQLYSCELSGKEVKLSEVTMGPVEIAEEALGYKLTEAGQKDREFWMQTLSGNLSKIEWVGSKPRPRLMSHIGGTIPFSLGQRDIEGIKNYAKERATTPFVVFLAAFARLVASKSGLHDVLVGTPVRNRESNESQNVLGYFVNSIALKFKGIKEQSFDEAVRLSELVLRQSLEHQSLPFSQVLEDLKLPRDPSRTAVFQSFFSYQDVSNREAKLAGTSYKQINIDKASTHTDLDVWIKLGKTSLEGAFEFRKDLFDSSLIEEWSQDFLRDIQSNITKKDIPFIVSQVETFAQISPKKRAITIGDSSFDYADLWKQVLAKSTALQLQGVGPGKIIGIHMSRSAEMVISLLAIMRAGGTYVPLDPMFPLERLTHMINVSEPLMIITNGTSSLNDPRCVSYNDLTGNGEFKPVAIDPHSAMYVIFTSGSTGLPKGVEVSYGNVENFLRSMSETPGINADDHLLAVTTLSFDIAVLELYLPLISGAHLVLASSVQVMDGDELIDLIERFDITMMQATPVTWRLMYGQNWKGKRNLKVLCGGEAFPQDLAARLIKDCRSVWNMYGPTETTVWSTCRRLVLNEKITIGSPIRNTTLLAIGENGQEVNRGEIGELWIGGDGVASGYYKRPDLTSERFLHYKGARYYRTGDLARQLSDDNWECLGRIDTQVKIRGYRIELEEIEVQLRKIPGIRDAVVKVQDFGNTDLRLVAYVVGELNVDSVKDSLSSHLPSYMQPSYYQQIEAVPMTPNGKVDRKALPDYKANETGVSFTDVKSVWCHYLNVSVLNEADDFFALGGNSLMAVEIIAAVQRLYNIEIGLAHLIQHSTYKEFNDLILEATTPKQFSSIVKISEDANLRPMFLFHGVGGNVMNYVVFTQSLKSKRSLYGVQSVGLDGKSPFITTIEAMAESYLKEIKRIQPRGPYLLAGGSMGGTIAFEVALLLQRLGEKVERVVMFDTFGPDVVIREPDPDESPFWPRIKSSISYRTRSAWLRIKRVTAKWFNRPVPLDVLLHALEATNFRALRHYKPGVFDGNITLIRAHMKPKGWYSDPDMGWHKVVRGKIETYYLDGQHHNFIENPKLAELLKKLL